MSRSAVPHFYCDFLTNNSVDSDHMSTRSYLCHRQIQWLLDGSDKYCNYWPNEESLDLFGINTIVNDWTSDKIKVFFTFVKKHLNQLRSDSMTRIGSNRDSFSNDYLRIRLSVSTFVALLKRYLFEICIQRKSVFKSESLSDNQFCLLVVQQFKALLLFMGRLSHLKPHLITLSITSDPKSSIHNYFHCCLDIWWSAVEVMYILDKKSEINLSDYSLIKEEIGTKGLTPQTIRLVLFDLIVFSVHRFNAIKSTAKYQTLSLFDCLCVKEMYVLLRHVFSAITSNASNGKFSELIVSNMNLVSNRETNESQSIHDFQTLNFDSHSPANPSLHYIWFMTNVVKTFNYDLSGQLTEDYLFSNPIPSGLTRKITLLLKQNDSKTEESLLPLIIFCINSFDLWKPTTDLILPFVDYFLKNLNKRYSSLSVEELSVIPKSSVKWHQIIEEISSNRIKSFAGNSFYLFLSLMSRQLLSVFTSCDPKTKSMNWQKFKGKLVVNVQPSKLDKLNQMGTLNLLTFYLVLNNVHRELWADFIDTTLEMSAHLLENRNHSNLVFEFVFVLLQIKAKPLSDEKICHFISDNYNKVCEQRSKNFGSDSLNRQFSDLTLCYFDELTQLLNCHQFWRFSLNKLLNIKFNLFSNLLISSEDQQNVVNFVSVLLNRINEYIEFKEDNFEMSSLISICFDSILPFIKSEISRKRNEHILIDIAYNFTKLSHALYKNKKFSDIFTEFLTIYRNNNESQSNYLSRVLQNPTLRQRLQNESSVSATALISIWTRLLVSPDITESSLQTLTHNMCLLVEELKSDESVEDSDTSHVFTTFIKNLMKTYENCDPSQRTSVIQRTHKFLNEMVITCEAVIASKTYCLMSIKRIFSLMSTLVSIGSQLIYIPLKADCLLSKILDSILVPTNLSTDMRQQLLPLINKCFPALMEGLFKLEYDGNQFLERQIRRIISLFLPLYVNQPNSLTILKNNLQKRMVYNDWKKLLYQTIVKNFFNRNESLPSPAIIQFIEDSCDECLSDEQMSDILDLCLQKVLSADIKSKDSLLSLVSAIVTKFERQQNQQLLTEKVFVRFIETNLANKSSLKRFFEVIDFICQSSPSLFHHFVGQINRSIETIEKKRNIGTDFILRNALREFANKNRF